MPIIQLDISRDVLVDIFHMRYNQILRALATQESMSIDELIKREGLKFFQLKELLTDIAGRGRIFFERKGLEWHCGLSETGREFVAHLPDEKYTQPFMTTEKNHVRYFDIVSLLYLFGGAETPNDIENLVNAPGANTVKNSLMGLEEQGYVYSIGDGNHNKPKTYCLTESGRELANGLSEPILYLSTKLKGTRPTELPEGLFDTKQRRIGQGATANHSHKPNEPKEGPKESELQEEAEEEPIKPKRVRYNRSPISQESQPVTGGKAEWGVILSKLPVVNGKALRKIRDEAWRDDPANPAKVYIAGLLDSLAKINGVKPSGLHKGMYFTIVKSASQNKSEFEGCNTYLIGQVLLPGEAEFGLEITRFQIREEPNRMNVVMVQGKTESLENLCKLPEGFSAFKVVLLEKRGYEILGYLLGNRTDTQWS